MHTEELQRRLSNKEDGFTERKPEGAGSSDFKKTIVAFANSVPEGNEAILFIGVDDKGAPLGVKNTDSLQKTIRQICEKTCYPSITHQSQVLSVDGKDILAIIIPHSTNRPHFTGPVYIRRGSESVIATEDAFEELIASRSSKCWEIMKWKNKLVTVIARGKELGSTKYLGDSRYHASHECRIEECNTHYIKFYDIATRRHMSEPLENVRITYDEAKNRLKLVVQN